MVGEAHVRGIQQLLARFGIFGRVRRKDDREADRQGTWVTVGRNRCRSETDSRPFSPFIDARKQDKLDGVARARRASLTHS